MTMLTISNLVKSIAADTSRRRSAPARVFAVNGISLEVGDGEMSTLLGPCGCGTTTTLLAAVHPKSLEIRTTGWGNRVGERPGTVTDRAFLGDAIDHVVQVG